MRARIISTVLQCSSDKRGPASTLDLSGQKEAQVYPRLMKDLNGIVCSSPFSSDVLQSHQIGLMNRPAEVPCQCMAHKCLLVQMSILSRLGCKFQAGGLVLWP